MVFSEPEGLERRGFRRISGLSREDEIRRALPEIKLTPEQADEAEQIADILSAKAQATVRYLSQLMASQANRQLFGETEFLMRDAVHRWGAEGIDIALHERNCVR